MTTTAAHPAPPSLSPWDFAGLMLTYGCNARCAFCYVSSGPDRGGRMSVDQAIRLWRGLTEHAAAHGRTMKVHLAGGEPFQEWQTLAAIVQAGRAAGLPPLEKVETNAGWAADDEQTRARLTLLRDLEVEKLTVSCDVFHQEYIPIARVQRCVRVAREVLGPGRLIVRWWDYFNDPIDTRDLPYEQKRAVFRAALEKHPDRMTGRAALELADLLPARPAADFAGQSCVREILQSRHVHIDPFGYVFPGTCGGIILGRVRDAAREQGTGNREQRTRTREQGPGAREQPVKVVSASGRSLPVVSASSRWEQGTRNREPGHGSETGTTETEADTAAYASVDALWRDLAASWPAHPVLGAVVSGGSYALLERVRSLGYVERPGGYGSKCHLCADIRQWLVQRGLWPGAVGPRACYP